MYIPQWEQGADREGVGARSTQAGEKRRLVGEGYCVAGMLVEGCRNKVEAPPCMTLQKYLNYLFEFEGKYK